MAELLALLLTDIVDSTRLNESVGDDVMASSWAAHDKMARELVRACRGLEVGRSDGFLLVFREPTDAIAFARAYHRGLAELALPMKARVGLHVGPVTLRRNSPLDVAQGATAFEIDGVALPLAARVMSSASGGQTLVTADAMSSLAAPTHASAIGHWRFKGIAEPIELFELVDDAGAGGQGPPADSPKGYRVVRSREGDWLPSRELPNNLPAERDAFVGRREIMQELSRCVDEGIRLITLVGIGGIGKTRVALRFARNWIGEFPGGAWFCDLSQATGLDGIAHGIANAFNVPLSKFDPVSQLAGVIRERGTCLVILDNFEQIVLHGEATAGRLMEACEEARFIVTSREALGIRGERVLSLPTLPNSEAVTLFAHRSSAVAGTSARATSDDPATVERLVGLLDGLPLAIELAAARSPVMSANAMLERMRERFNLLAARTGRLDRQATLRATLDWSWMLLSKAERRALAQLSVFEGGFTLESAEAVIDLAEFDDCWPLDVIHGLVQKSLVRGDAEHRFHMLQMVQHFAREQLLATEGAADRHPPGQLSPWARHWLHFAAIGEIGARRDRCVEIDNLVAACRRAAEHGDSDASARALTCAWSALRLTGPFNAAVALAAAVEPTFGSDANGAATSRWVSGSAQLLLGQMDAARQSLVSALDFEGINDGVRSRILCSLGQLETTAGNVHAALELLERALVLATGLKDRLLECQALNALGGLFSDRAMFAEAIEHYSRALAIAEDMGDRRWIGGLQGNLGLLNHGMGRYAEARTQYAGAIEDAVAVGDRRWEGNARCNLGLLHFDAGDPLSAASEFALALTIARTTGHLRLECTVLCNMGLPAESMGALDEAVSHFESALALAQRLGDKRMEGQCRTYLGRTLARQGRVAQARDTLKLGESQLLAAADEMSLGLLYCSAARVEWMAGDAASAAAYAQRAAHCLGVTGAQPTSELGRELASVERALGEGHTA